MLKVVNLEKSYGNIKALKGISFSVKKGCVFGLLGPNGAGKTTTFKILSTLLSPDSGNIFWCDMDIFKNKKLWKRQMGFVPQNLALYSELTGYENIMLMASLYGLDKKEKKKRCLYLLDKIGLKERMNDKVLSYSGGMKRRLNLIMGIVHNPEVILLDEPTAGIDVQTKRKIYQFIKELVNEGKTILYTTHLLKEAEELFDIVAIIDEGEIKAVDSLGNLIAEYANSVKLELLIDDFKGREKFLSMLGALSEKGLLMIDVKSQKEISPIIEKITSEGLVINSIKIKGASLETVFLNLTGKELRD